MSVVTRFAPSPTGPLHLGHAFSACLAHDMARAEQGRFLLRIEDIDRARARPDWEAQIAEDLRWLGLAWDGPVRRQSDHMDAYGIALDALWARGLLYPCHCTRRDIQAALSAPQEGVAMGPDGPVYPGTCRPTRPGTLTGARPRDVHLRLDMARALDALRPESVDQGRFAHGTGPTLRFSETGPDHSGTVEVASRTMIDAVGDVVLARRDFGTSYHLSVVVDDGAQGVTHVVRGADLFDATPIHVLLQRLLHLPTPVYHHHRLIRDETGKRLAKRDDARALATYRAAGLGPGDIRRMVGLADAQEGAINSTSSPPDTSV